MRVLYHYPTSPFSRRVRLALALKGLEVELRDARANPAYHDEVRRIWPLRTVPVLVEESGHVLGDSSAILHYLDGAYPTNPPLWPRKPESLRQTAEVCALVEGALDTLVDVGTRYYAISRTPEWRAVADEMVGRTQGALSMLADIVSRERGGRTTITDEGWGAGDITLFTAIAWLEGLPGRASSTPNIAQIVSLAWSLPTPLTRWADAHRERTDVRALG